MGGGNHGHTLLFVVLCFFTRCESWNWFSSSSSSTSYGSNNIRGSVAEFSTGGLNDRKGVKLVENAKEKMVRSNWCWQNAYKNVFAGCSEILVDEEKRSRLAWHLSDCFQKDSSRPHFPHCDPKSSMSKCLKALDDVAHKVYLEFYLETNSICHQLQAHAFKHETERLITDLKNSAHYVEDKLDNIYDKSENLLRDSKKIHDTLDSVNVRTQQIDEALVNVEDRTEVLMRNSESIFEQTKKTTDSQLEIKKIQQDTYKRFKEGIEVVNESYNKLGQEMRKLRDGSIEIQNEIIKVGDAVSQEMQILHITTENIADLAGISLHNQQHLIDGQNKALHDLNSLFEFQSKAVNETRMTFQQLAKVGYRHHQEVLLRQEQLQGLHDRLMTNSKSILAAQESFESKQANMLTFLEKIFSLQNAMFLESRIIKTLIVYVVSVFVIYMLTSTKQTYNTRPWLYIELCVVLFMEISMVRGIVEERAWIITLTRLAFTCIAFAQLLYGIFSYKDYQVLNYHLLQNLADKVSNLEQRDKQCWMMDDEEEDDDDLDWSQFIDSDLLEEANCTEDPDFIFPIEEVGGNSITFSPTRYNLRSQKSHYH